MVRNGEVHADLTPDPLASNDETLDVALDVAPGHWVRVNIRDADGITVMGNPIYVR